MEELTYADRANGPAFSDRLDDCGDDLYDGDDKLILAKESHRLAWMRVLCKDIKDHEASGSPCQRVGDLSLFRLILTANEVLDLYRVGVNEGVISPVGAFEDSSGWTIGSERWSGEWRLTDIGKKMTGLRGTNLKDTIERLPTVARQAYVVATVLLTGAVSTILIGLGVTVAAGSAWALALASRDGWVVTCRRDSCCWLHRCP